MSQIENKEDLIKELTNQYAIKGYLTEGKIRVGLADINDTEAAVEKIKAFYDEACKKRESAYQNRVGNFKTAETIQDYENVKETLEALDGYKDSAELVLKCQMKINELKKLRANERKEVEAVMEQQLTEVYRQDKKELKWMIVGGIVLMIVFTVILLWVGERVLLL